MTSLPCSRLATVGFAGTLVTRGLWNTMNTPASRFQITALAAWAASAAFVLALAMQPGPAFAAGALEPVALDATFKPAEQAGRVFTVAQGQALKGVTRVAVPLFTVDFVTADNASAETSGFAAAGRARATSYYKLMGVGQADFQAVTDAAYARFLADLKAAGHTLVAPDRLQASAAYRKLVASAKPAPALRDDGMVLAPAGMVIYGFSEVAAGAGKPGLFSGIAAMGSAFSAVGAALETAELAKELDAAIVEVQLRVQFVQLTNENKGFLGRMASTAEVSAKVYPSIASATYNVQSSTRGTLTLKQPLALDAGVFTNVRKAPTTTADIASGIAVGLLQLAIGSGSTSSSEEMEAVADAGRYASVVGDGVATLNKMFVQRLRAGE